MKKITIEIYEDKNVEVALNETVKRIKEGCWAGIDIDFNFNVEDLAAAIVS